MTDGLAEWLLAQIAEDEHAARQASGSTPESGPAGGEHWHWVHAEEPDVDQPVDLADGDDPPFRTDLRSVERYSTTTVGPLPHFAIAYSEEVEHRVARHIVMWDPARVLAECDAKRKMIEWLLHPATDSDVREPALDMLALPYADRPGSRDVWT